MARYKFGGTNADGVFSVSVVDTRHLLTLASASLTFWDAETGGSQYTDLLDAEGASVSSVVTGLGQVPVFWGPDGVSELWADDGDGTRALMAGRVQVPTSAAEVGAEPAGLSQATSDALSATYARRPEVERRRGARAPGVVMFTWDDGFDEHDTIRQMATDRDQRHTFCINTGSIDVAGYMTSAQIAQAFNEGHEIAAHSVTHANMTSLSVAAREAEYDNSKAALEAIIGAGNVTTWSYPYGSASAGRNLTTDSELYLRYGRLLDTAGALGKGVYPRDSAPFVITRASYNPSDATQHSQLLAYIRKAAESPIIVSIYAHDAPTQTALDRVAEAMDLAQSLGVPCITAAEAFPGHPRYVIDPGFEDYPTGSGQPWVKMSGTATTVTDPGPDGMGGSKVLHLSTPDGSGASWVSQDIPVKAGSTVSASWKCKVNQAVVTAGGLKAYVALRYGYQNTAGTTEYGPAQTSTTWATGSKDFTVPANATWANIQIVLGSGVVGGEAWFDHLWIDEKNPLGTYG